MRVIDHNVLTIGGGDGNMSQTAMRRYLRAASCVASWAAGIIIAVLMWNLIVSLAVLKPTGYYQDLELGRTHRPGLYVHGAEGFSWSHIGLSGVRIGAQDDESIPEGARLLFLGDSYTEAFQVPFDQSFPELLERALSESRGRVVSINAGRSGASPAYYIAAQSEIRRRFRPDTVVIQMSDQDFASDLVERNRNFYVVKRGDSYSAVFNRHYTSANPAVRKFPFLTQLLEVPIARVVLDKLDRLRGSESLNVPDALPVVSRPLMHWVAVSLALAYPDAVILYIPSVSYESNPDSTTPVERIAIAELTDAGLRVVNPRDALVDDFESSGQPGFGFENAEPMSGHMNARGHAVVAKVLSDVLEPRELQ